MGTPSLESAPKKVEYAKANVERAKKDLAIAKQWLAQAKQNSYWKRKPKCLGYIGKPGLYREEEITVFSYQDALEKAKKALARAKEDLARAKKK